MGLEPVERAAYRGTMAIASPPQRPRRRVRFISALPRRAGLLSSRSEGSGSRSGVVVAALLAIAGITSLVAVLLLITRDQPPGDGSVDAGFARDMSVHHGQAVQMAITAQNRTDNESIRILAFDIMLTQHGQINIMQAWLDVWGLSTVGEGPSMAWMGGTEHDHSSEEGSGSVRMPGWITQEEMAALEALPVAEMNQEFLRMMIRHHEGGVVMAEAAVDRAETPQIRDLARAIIVSQESEIDQMEQMLAELSS